MQIGILETGHAPEALQPRWGRYPAFFARLLDRRGLAFRSWAVVDMEFPDSVQAADGWLITGSRHGAYDDLPFIPPLEQFVRDAIAARVPVVGICFGHQIIAQALGGRVEKYSGGWQVGPQDYDFAGRTLRLNAWHQDQVIAPPDGAEVIATHPDCRYAGLRYGDRALSVQAHPEFDSDFFASLIETRGRGLVPEPILEAAVARLDRPLDTPRIADTIEAFLRHPRTGSAA